ncbi:MAG TPA: hypothetical protein VJ781_00655 [Pyrinomonadaceae bacterium]|nr:hypothetical protein [Pyrinomonadaceae bacterium]
MTEREFTVGQIRPIECVKEAFSLIKDEYWVLLAVSVVGGVIAAISLYVLVGAMVCGIFACYLRKIDGGRVKFEDLFTGFSYFWSSLLVTILIVVPIVVWILVLFTTLYLPLLVQAVGGENASDNEILSTLVVVFVIDVIVALVMVCFHSLLIFCFPLIVDRGLSSWDSIKLSARATVQNLGGIGGLIGLNFIMALGGLLVFCIGVYLVIPLMTASNLLAYRKVFPK